MPIAQRFFSSAERGIAVPMASEVGEKSGSERRERTDDAERGQSQSLSGVEARALPSREEENERSEVSEGNILK